MKKIIYITAGALILVPISTNAATLEDCKTTCATTTATSCSCDSKTTCYDTEQTQGECSHQAYISESACKKANPGKTCSRASHTYRTLQCFTCDGVHPMGVYPAGSNKCGNGGSASNDKGYYSYTVDCTATSLGAMTVTCFLPD